MSQEEVLPNDKNANNYHQATYIFSFRQKLKKQKRHYAQFYKRLRQKNFTFTYNDLAKFCLR